MVRFSQLHIKVVQPALSFSRSLFSTKLASSISVIRELSLQYASPTTGSQDSWRVIETQENSATTSMEQNSSISVTTFRRHTRAEFILITMREIWTDFTICQENGSVTTEIWSIQVSAPSYRVILGQPSVNPTERSSSMGQVWHIFLSRSQIHLLSPTVFQLVIELRSSTLQHLIILPPRERSNKSTSTTKISMILAQFSHLSVELLLKKVFILFSTLPNTSSKSSSIKYKS